MQRTAEQLSAQIKEDLKVIKRFTKRVDTWVTLYDF
jgi:hypothetical protein